MFQPEVVAGDQYGLSIPDRMKTSFLPDFVGLLLLFRLTWVHLER